ncbi:hypothetical protein STCU_11548 [Strigomonas culicis]|uniref:Uncharacterized protein n=1 Tax=Strigomonas culicis TaxID=28005 RepID=S9TDN7_9TRYP|nr:hypothetical protein STCU_11548 [Strigomonas culicis]|eukprot:EPY16107.1 hypothetical protein STCU_11548 [Strigomonas culicis]
MSRKRPHSDDGTAHWNGLSDEEVDERARRLLSPTRLSLLRLREDTQRPLFTSISTGLAALDTLIYSYWNPVFQSSASTPDSHLSPSNSTFPPFHIIEFYSFFGGGKSYLLKPSPPPSSSTTPCSSGSPGAPARTMRVGRQTHRRPSSGRSFCV